METENKTNEVFWQEMEKNHRRGKILGGLLIVIIGALFLGRELGMNIPEWIFTWKMLLIAIGTMMIVKSGFRSGKGIFLILIGGAFLASDMYPAILIKPLLWPILIILFGLFIIFKPRRKQHYLFRKRMYHKYHRHHHHGDWHCDNPGQNVDDDKIESTTFMGAVKKNILSKNFKGGEITNVLGGAEINLSQADFEGTATLEITNVLGGTKMIIPANWGIQSELVSVMGSIEDKRPLQPNLNVEKSKILILRGTVFMGGIDIKSY